MRGLHSKTNYNEATLSELSDNNRIDWFMNENLSGCGGWI
jgi:hypothetical protein